MTDDTKNLEERTIDAPNVRPGRYLLYAMNKEGFEEIKPQLSGDDYFFHDAEKYPHPTGIWKPNPEKNVSVWMHFSHDRDSGAARILKRMSPDTIGRMKFLDAWNSGYMLTMDKEGNYTSIYGAEK